MVGIGWTFREFLEATEGLQAEAFGDSPAMLYGKPRAEWLRWNVLAAVDELMEFLHEWQWKPWKDDQGRLIDRDAAVEELVDVLHFFGNLCTALGIDEEELRGVYERKAKKNRDRQRQLRHHD